MEVYLIRHGESKGNAQGIHQGQKNNFSLSKLGKEQVIFLREKFENLKINAIYSSDLKRAKETAEIIASEKKLNLIYDEKLRERSFGLIGEEKNILESWKKFVKKEKEERGIEERDVVPPKGESDRDHFNRVKSFFDDLINKHEIKDKIIVIAHGGTNKVAMGVIGHLPISEMYKLPQRNTCVNKLIFDGKKWEAESTNCIDHLIIDSKIKNNKK